MARSLLVTNADWSIRNIRILNIEDKKNGPIKVELDLN